MWAGLLLSLPMLSLAAARSPTALAFALGKRPSLLSPRRYASASATLSAALSGNLVSLDDCLAAFGKTDDGGRTVFVDGSWHLSKDRDGRAEYETGPRIKGARFFDIDDVSSKGGELNPKGLPHMMPPKALFAATMDALDITNSDRLVVYGTKGCMFTARAWYALRAMGHPSDRVHLMQGSLAEWQEKGGEIETGEKKAISTDDLDLTGEPKYKATDAANFVDMDDVLKVVTGGTDLVIDARGAARFRAEAPEPRAGLRGGHMLGSLNVPFTDLLDPDDPLKFKSAEELRAVFEGAGVDVGTERRIICSCGSGVTACAVAVALEECGRDPKGTYIYDGSWTEWGSDPDTPVVS